MAEINHPSYYKACKKDLGVEVWDILDYFFPDNPHLWQAVGYLLRAGKKPGSPYADDLGKAIVYIKHNLDSEEQPKWGSGRGYPEHYNCRCSEYPLSGPEHLVVDNDGEEDEDVIELPEDPMIRLNLSDLAALVDTYRDSHKPYTGFREADNKEGDTEDNGA